MKRRTLLISLGALMFAAASGYLWKTSVGLEQAPDITVVTTTGERIPLASMRGKPLLVTFWATTCPSCMKEIPHLTDLYRELSPRGLKVIGIAMFYDPPNRVLAVQKSHNIPYIIGLDIDARVARAFGNVKLTPTTFLIASDGRVVYRKTGSIDMNRVRNGILAMLRSVEATSPTSAGNRS
jgi:peroxiredoxin